MKVEAEYPTIQLSAVRFNDLWQLVCHFSVRYGHGVQVVINCHQIITEYPLTGVIGHFGEEGYGPYTDYSHCSVACACGYLLSHIECDSAGHQSGVEGTARLNRGDG